MDYTKDEMKGRRLAHYMWDELEKIAYAGAALGAGIGALVGGVRGAQKHQFWDPITGKRSAIKGSRTGRILKGALMGGLGGGFVGAGTKGSSITG